MRLAAAGDVRRTVRSITSTPPSVLRTALLASLTASKMSHRKIRSLSAHCRSSLVETDFLNHTLHIHRRAHEWYSADTGSCCIGMTVSSRRSAPPRSSRSTQSLSTSFSVSAAVRRQRSMGSRPPGRCSWPLIEQAVEHPDSGGSVGDAHLSQTIPSASASWPQGIDLQRRHWAGDEP